MENGAQNSLWPFENVVMPFGFTNAPIIFQHMINDVFRKYMDDFLV
jgi:hypothetical protein